MFVNKLNQLYKPYRRLYYSDATSEQIEAFRKGTPFEAVSKFEGAFGTYDHVGVFYVKQLGRFVIGIEYRVGDERVRYPDDLKYIELEGTFFYSVEVDDGVPTDKDAIREIFEKIALDDDAHRSYSDLSIKEETEVIGIFESERKERILYEWKVDIDRAAAIINDDMDALKKKTLYRQSFFDPITKHYNWNHLQAFLEMPMDYGINDYAFVHFDIKEFRVINEVYGHIAANRVLCNIVKAMNEAEFVYASARCHNDNFAMMIEDMPEDEMIECLQDFFEKLSYFDGDPNYKIYYRVGVVPMQRTILNGNRVADAAKLAQSLGQNMNKTEITIFTDKMHDDISWGNYIKASMDNAVSNDEFMVFFQPKFDITGDETVLKGIEALVRWNYRQEDILSPVKFVPFFERDGSIGKIDDVVLKKSCETLARWKREGKNLYTVSVNLSRSRFYFENLIDHLVSIVDSYHVDHHYIEFELTESATYEDMDHMMGILEELRDKGFQISMDDFGTGYSSLSLLTEMPLDTLKIDKSFVDKLGLEHEKKSDVAVISHIISLAKELGFTTLAEGAENEAQVRRLKELGCETIQGYYFSKPVTIEEFEKKYIK
ncbi:EAL domain-containing protein (putative c-di-GMP-specific phosphodiesterase class I) [Ruminococcaceae bacterium R-25]|nr:EAL domain-containing protein (putative c-di-GMP-specific phosphodiesterase class I) [Ruminococcaceae bacterium R-25]SUQ22101.1 EAL domain, c-di-GMP-specific phosphodiesterase class I (or its enzymatically inactive variant) [Oscillospiraceae bacterium]